MTNPIPPVRVDIVEGDNSAVPGLKRTGDEIAKVAAGASSGLSPIQKLSKAMVLAEGREGSLVLRELRGAVTGLGAEALGASGPLGRLGVTLAEFGIGGGVGLAAVAGIAAIGYAWKKADEAAQLAAENAVAVTERLKRVFGTVMKQHGDDPAEGLNLLRRAATDAKAALDQLAAAPLAAQQFRNVVTPQGLTVSVATNNPVQERADAIAAADNKARAAQQALNDALKAAADAGDKVTDALKRQGDALTATNAIRARAIASGQDEDAMLVDVAGATARAQAAVLGLDEAHTAALVTQAKRLERLKLETAALEEQQNVLQEIERISESISDFMTGRTITDPWSGAAHQIGGEGQDEISRIHIPTLDEILGRNKFGQDINFEGREAFMGKSKRDALEMALPFGKQAGDSMGKAFVEKALNKPGPDAGRIAGDSVALINAIQGGSAGAAVSQLGALLGATKVIPVPAVQAFAAAGSLLDGFAAERRHRELLQALKRIEQKAQLGPSQLRPIFVGATPANAAQTAYEVGRLQDRDAIPRGVGGP